uniref:J domain-containing protein n=1 Tax=Attheya septentrionalis TaxID=420275 RepID=A0A7S2UIS6_9STRA|mmetsp:Transcript_27242/g.49496  ORF Transcript_27242/g.49496 Transcript_27242/m.49496 type:complete len:250 (+) Transcript_27242:233-982(+)|eukprot:CAMPEP_0198302886 /NCGR_PEP_ID=MMETSP1449-20131203/56600_1 /TAXON_ID=420275 /ORGANISM="Attheya septentrionalis, Strain CCMP2084" /LENGTH=249 /DNA_ID=CAMNT_0044005359 /DNA_START=191 /DNA_END=940 /DNA_ORIENTATION=+
MVDNEDVIEAVLKASHHYEVLGISQAEEDPSVLRRAYLTKSVKVHPDKNPNDTERATEAFQRVAQAWNVVQDPSERAHYDSFLKNGASSETEEPFCPPPPPSFQEALFAFAAVTSMMMNARGGSRSSASAAASSFAENLYFAKKLSEGRQQQQQQRGAEGVDNGAEETAHNAMALGASLRVVGAVANGMGFKQVGTMANRSATAAQAVGVGTLLTKDSPQLRKALEKGVNAISAMNFLLQKTSEKKNIS